MTSQPQTQIFLDAIAAMDTARVPSADRVVVTERGTFFIETTGQVAQLVAVDRVVR